MKLAQLLFSQGFGTRRECAALVAHGLVEVEGLGSMGDAKCERRVVDDAEHELGDPAGRWFRVRGERWPYHERALIVLNKPAGYECSLKPRHHPSVYSLLPAPLRHRGVQAIGRLDEDTTGALLFTDDGALVHRLTSPKRHVAKVYEVRCKHAVDTSQIERLLAGVVLHDDHETVRAAACETSGECGLRLTLKEGKYHQVKRMVAAVGNRVEGLHRSAFGSVRVEGLATGSWRWANAAADFANVGPHVQGPRADQPSQRIG